MWQRVLRGVLEGKSSAKTPQRNFFDYSGFLTKNIDMLYSAHRLITNWVQCLKGNLSGSMVVCNLRSSRNASVINSKYSSG